MIKTLLRHQISCHIKCLCLGGEFLCRLSSHKLKTENSISTKQNDFHVPITPTHNSYQSWGIMADKHGVPRLQNLHFFVSCCFLVDSGNF